VVSACQQKTGYDELDRNNGQRVGPKYVECAINLQPTFLCLLAVGGNTLDTIHSTNNHSKNRRKCTTRTYCEKQMTACRERIDKGFDLL
jgi:hypothetical protein